MKIAPIIKALQNDDKGVDQISFRLVHTGQHYDARMSENFFSQLGIPKPHKNLEVGSGTQAEQTAAILTCYEKLLMNERTDLCLVVGDVTSTMACAITAKKLGVPVAHVEAGIRSGDWSMPEEINRVVTDSVSNYFFTTSETANKNLLKTGVEQNRIFFVGNTMIDTLLANMERLRAPAFWAEHDLRTGQYFVVTLHRPSNVDELDGFAKLLQSIGQGTGGMPVIFPVHPRTAKTLSGVDLVPNNILLVEPQPYLEFNYLVKNAKAVITDSGGITEEATLMGIPCMTLRDSTERPETVTIGTNELLGTDPDAIIPAMNKLFSGNWKSGNIPPKWDGETGKRIVKYLYNILNF
jgi:UDP-N-acetylglucosamine 2-epimerase (non-hydrolysing)